MLSNLGRGRFPLAWVCLVLAAAPLPGQRPGRAATLRVRMRADAQLVINDYQTQQTGQLRRFVRHPWSWARSTITRSNGPITKTASPSRTRKSSLSRLAALPERG